MIAIIEDKPYQLRTGQVGCVGCAFKERSTCPPGSTACVSIRYGIWVPAGTDEQTDDGGLLPPQGALE